MGEKPDNSRDDQGEPKEKKRLDLSVPQVAGSAVAAVVAAKLASGLGVYGTILGAGVVSALATCGGTLFQHFFRRTGEQIRDAAVTSKPKGRQVPVTAEGRPVPRTFRSDTSMDATTAMVTGERPPAQRPAMAAVPTTTTWGRAAAADAEETAMVPQLSMDSSAGSAGSAGSVAVGGPGADFDKTQMLDTGAVADLLDDTGAGATGNLSADDPDRTRLLGTAGAADPDRTQLVDSRATDDATRVLRPAPDDATRVLRPAAGSPGQPLPPGGPDEEPEEFTEGTVHRTRVKSWKRPLIAAAVVFGVTMGGITTYELVSGQSFSGDGKSTTIGDAFKGRHGSAGGGSEPTPSTSQQPSDTSSTGSDDGTQNGDGSSTSGNTTPTPTPSGSGDSDTGSDHGTGTGSDTGSDSGSDNGSDTGDDTSNPTPTPTPSQSGDTGTGPTSGSGGQSPAE
ncbi:MULTISPECIES: hypothetical protein [unclassified Streptomyces]|uniref:hypothetical protein n=1 Tax=unclassified Streptomyces TaxID=2593676 RepID=UPI00035F2A8C|nr:MULTISPECIES: hypothetical protein [unclassified Streptomyces]